jgi:adenylate cyclase class 2
MWNCPTSCEIDLMPVEIEAKMKVNDLAVIKQRLIACGATLIGEFLERNTFFDTEDRTLLAADEGLRLRQNLDLNTGKSVCIMTFKGPRQHGQLKSREETETTVGSFADASGLIERMGFMKVLSFEKRRDSWSLNGCEVELDNLPRLGTFVEIEGPRDETVLKTREMLQLTDRPLVRASYIAMLMTNLQEAGDPTHEVLFPGDLAKQRVA